MTIFYLTVAFSLFGFALIGLAHGDLFVVFTNFKLGPGNGVLGRGGFAGAGNWIGAPSRLAGLHLLAGQRHLAIERGVAGARPQQPQALLGVAAHQAALVAQPLVQERRVAHRAAVRDPDHRLGPLHGLGAADRLQRFGARFRRLGECRECRRC